MCVRNYFWFVSIKIGRGKLNAILIIRWRDTSFFWTSPWPCQLFTASPSPLHRSRRDRHPHAGASSHHPPWADSHSAHLVLLISKLTCPLPLFVHVLALSDGIFHETCLMNTLSVAPNKQWKDPALWQQTASVKHMTCANLQDDRNQSISDLRGGKKQERILVQTGGQQAETKFVQLNFGGL